MAKLGNNPLLKKDQPAEEPVLTEKDIETIRTYQSDAENFMAMSFKIRKDHLRKLRDYAYTERLTIKDALDNLLADALGRINDDDLLQSPEREKIPRRKR